MLFNRLISLFALLSVAGHVLAAPIPSPRPLEIEKGPLEIEHDRCETEVELGKSEIEIETGKSSSCSDRRMAVRSHPTRSPSASVVDAQKQLDILAPQIDEDMKGQIGSIEKNVGAHLTAVDAVVHTLEGQLSSFVGDKDEILYQNPEGTGQMTGAELAQHFSTLFLSISDIEEAVQHVSGYTVTSAQLNMRNDLLSMKKTLATLLPDVRGIVANNMATALSMGTRTMA